MPVAFHYKNLYKLYIVLDYCNILSQWSNGQRTRFQTQQSETVSWVGEYELALKF